MKWIYAIFRYIYRILKSFYDYLFCTDEELSQEFFQQSESTPVSGGFGSFSTLVIIAQDNMDAIKREEMDAQELQCLLYTQYVRVFMNDLIGGFPQVDILEENANLETEKEEKLKEEVLGRRSDYKNSYYAIQRAIFLRLNIGDLEKNIAESSSALFDEQKTECPEINLDFIFEYIFHEFLTIITNGVIG